MARQPMAPPRIERLLIVCPTWLGDTVMATPTLRAIRGLYPSAHITALVRAPIRPVLEGSPWIDRFATVRPRRKGRADVKRGNMLPLARRLAKGRFDTAVLLPNSFRTALVVRLAGIGRRIGYDRDGRGGLLTDRLLPRRQMGRFVPVSTRDYYLGIACYLGAVEPSTRLELFTRPQDEVRAEALLAAARRDLKLGQGDGQPLVILNAGANYGEAKMWHPDRFAQVADRCVEQFGAVVALSGAVKERPILERVESAARHPMINLPRLGVDLGLLKSIVRRASLMITNDTGPRHVAAAFDVPVVTIFGPTDPAWTDIEFAGERQVRAGVYCSPCQKKKCPLRGTPDDHICMRRVDTDMVFGEAAAILRSGGRVSAAV